MSDENKLIEEFLYQVASKNVNEDRSADFRDVFGTDNVGALLQDIHQAKEAEHREVFNEPVAPKPAPTISAVAADQAAAVAKKGIQVGKIELPPEKLASLITNPKFIDILTQIKKENKGKNIKRVGEPPPPNAWQPQVIRRPKA